MVSQWVRSCFEDRTATMALSERESHYEQQIKDHQEKIKELMAQNEAFQQEIKRRREEIEEKDTENRKQFEQLQKDLKERGTNEHGRIEQFLK